MSQNANAVNTQIDANRTVVFCGKRYFLSSLHPSHIVSEGRTFQSVEHLYQYWKVLTLAGKEAAEEYFISVGNITEVKKVVKRVLFEYGVTQKETREWRQKRGPIVLYYANALKFLQHAKLGEGLLNTEQKLLVQAYPFDDFFSAGLEVEEVRQWLEENNGHIVKFSLDIGNSEALMSSDKIANGYNVLGVTLMKLRGALNDLKNGNLGDPIVSRALKSTQQEDNKNFSPMQEPEGDPDSSD
ncbi:hypothetical protein L596_020825 [Steinernema carpocapsae]|uniref:NADAR domain-containing protein n=1 Tax=Steinernema carpocapsae TaxID=34508 RepID=A0A4U5MUJ2_STECR|nr:hypothetical protein L596_020749 [Steinernema carpocapsae]TKR73525.1 hypothetical protein L596_020825 [Steinernema carpocapsae]